MMGMINVTNAEWARMDPYDVIAAFQEERLGDAETDHFVKALRLSLDSVCIINPTEGMSERIDQLLETGLYGTRESEVLERLACTRLIQMIEDDSPLLTVPIDIDIPNRD